MSDRVAGVASLTVLGELVELKTRCLSSQKKLMVAQASGIPKGVLFSKVKKVLKVLRNL